MHKVAREYMPARHAPALIEELAAPPPIFGRGGNGDDILPLEIELLWDRRGIVIQGSHCNHSTPQHKKAKKNKDSRTVEEYTPPVLSILLSRRLRERLRLRLRECHRLRRRGPGEVPATSVRDVLALMLWKLLILLRGLLLLRGVSLLLIVFPAVRARRSALLPLLLLLLLQSRLHAVVYLRRVVHL